MTWLLNRRGIDAPLTAYFAAEVVTEPAGFCPARRRGLTPIIGHDHSCLRELAVLSLAQTGE